MRFPPGIAILIVLFAACVASAQENPLCGKIPSGMLTIPSYRFIVVNESGQPVEHLRITASIQFETPIWRGGWIDGYADLEPRTTDLPMTFEVKDAVYLSQKVPNLKLKDTGTERSHCFSKLKRFFLSFNADNQIAGFGIYLWDKRLEEVAFPDPQTPITITLRAKQP
jgi:hypothetical protein